MLFFGQFWPKFRPFCCLGWAKMTKNFHIFGQISAKFLQKTRIFSQSSNEPILLPKKFWGCCGHWEVFRTRQHIFGIFRIFRPNKPKWPFFAKFELKISQRVNPVQKRSRYEKSFKFFILSENVAKKGFSHPERTQNHKWQISSFENLRFVICGFGCVLGVKSPFWQHFRKVWKI